jgi:putative RecB family exonuclease
MTTLEIPTRLPVDYLSVSSIRLYLQCPMKWKRRYIDREYEPANGPMVLGSSVGAAEAQADHTQIDTGDRLATTDVLDLFSDEWEDRTGREDIDWRDDKPGQLKDAGIAVVQEYERTVGPNLRPVSVEREFSLEFEGVDWTVTGYFDLEEEDDVVADRKVRGRKMSPADAHVDIQPTMYLLAKRAEGNPAPRFDFHTLVRTKTPSVEVISTVRTDTQLDHFTDRILGVAAEINWRLESGVWQGAVPGSWWCSSRFCGYHASCPMGGGA